MFVSTQSLDHFAKEDTMAEVKLGLDKKGPSLGRSFFVTEFKRKKLNLIYFKPLTIWMDFYIINVVGVYYAR